jgi:hypothetical protein
MGRFLRNIVVAVIAIFTLTGCFKEVTTATTLRIKVLSEEVSGGDRVPAEGCYAYIYYTDDDSWIVESYEEAAAKIITNAVTGDKLSEPDGDSEIFTSEEFANSYLSLFQENRPALVVVVYPEAKMYAYIHRKAEAENLHYTYLTLIFHKWKTGTYYEGSKEGYKWTVVAPEATTND